MAIANKKDVIQDLSAKNEAKLHSIKLGDVISDFGKLGGACLIAKNAGTGYVEVTDELFGDLANGQDTDTVCYGAVEVYREGSYDKIQAFRKVKPEDSNSIIGGWRKMVVK